MNDILKLIQKYNADRVKLFNFDYEFRYFLIECFKYGEIDIEFFKRNKSIIKTEWIDYYFFCLNILKFDDIYKPEEVISSSIPLTSERLYNYLVLNYSENRLLNCIHMFSINYVVKIIESYNLSKETALKIKELYKQEERITKALEIWQNI